MKSPEGPEKPEGTLAIGTLTIQYVNEIPEIMAGNGAAIPGEIVVVDAQGSPVARYTGTALPPGAATSRTQVVPGVLHPHLPPASPSPSSAVAVACFRTGR